MDINDLYVGMVCDSAKGAGKVTGVDVRTGQVYMADMKDDHEFCVNFEELVENPQVHNCDDTYY